MATESAHTRVAPANPRGWSYQQTMLRVKDPKKAVDYYTQHFGMTVLDIKRFPDPKFDLYFLASMPEGAHPPTPGTPEANAHLWSFPRTVLELTHNYGTETDEAFKCENGNTEPYRGFGHVGFIVDDVYAFCADLESKGVKFQKRPDDGKMKGIAFALDADGYWVEILPRSKTAPATEIVGKPSFQQTMLRIRDPAVTVPYYEKHFNMSLVCRRDFPEMKFSLYFMGTFPAGTVLPADPSSEAAWQYAGSLSSTLVEFTHNHGTESDPEFKGYHNGNTDPGRGYGHIGFLVNDLEPTCVELEAAGVTFTKRPHEGRMRGLAFAKDPDGYLVEIIQNAATGKRPSV